MNRAELDTIEVDKQLEVLEAEDNALGTLRMVHDALSPITIIVNESTSVRLSGAVLDVFFHGVRIHAQPMTASADEYCLGYLRRLAISHELRHRDKMADEEIARLQKEIDTLKAKRN